MKELLEKLFPLNRYLLGKDYDAALAEVATTIGSNWDTIEAPSGTKVFDWCVPDEWVIRDGWIKFNGKKILDYKTNPLSIMVGSGPVNKTVKRQELLDHLFVSDEHPDKTSYEYRFYKEQRDWGFSMPKDRVKQGNEIVLPEGEYEVFIDSEHRPGIMKVGVHTIPGKSEREILLFAHLDHPFQANDNLSGVVCLVGMAKKLREARFNHTIKLIFCPETIGGLLYVAKEDISKVDFVIAVDSVGNEGTMLIQKSYNKEDRLNKVMHLAHSGQAIDYRKGDFRLLAGGEEYFFNDPRVGIPGIFISRIGDKFDHYHTSEDTPEKINYEKIEETQRAILRLIDIYEKDFIPERLVTGPLMRVKYGIQTEHKTVNLSMDYLWYDIDGKKYLSELILPLGLSFETAYEAITNLINGGAVQKKNSRTSGGKGKI